MLQKSLKYLKGLKFMFEKTVFDFSQYLKSLKFLFEKSVLDTSQTNHRLPKGIARPNILWKQSYFEIKRQVDTFRREITITCI